MEVSSAPFGSATASQNGQLSQLLSYLYGNSAPIGSSLPSGVSGSPIISPAFASPALSFGGSSSIPPSAGPSLLPSVYPDASILSSTLYPYQYSGDAYSLAPYGSVSPYYTYPYPFPSTPSPPFALPGPGQIRRLRRSRIPINYGVTSEYHPDLISALFPSYAARFPVPAPGTPDRGLLVRPQVMARNVPRPTKRAQVAVA